MYMAIFMLAPFALGVAAGYGWARRADGRDLIAETLADRAMERMDGLPEPTDEEIGRMIAASRLAQDSTPFAFVVMALGTALLRCRRARREG